MKAKFYHKILKIIAFITRGKFPRGVKDTFDGVDAVEPYFGDSETIKSSTRGVDHTFDRVGVVEPYSGVEPNSKVLPPLKPTFWDRLEDKILQSEAAEFLPDMTEAEYQEYEDEQKGWIQWLKDNGLRR